MGLWNFIHYNIGMHVYELLAVVMGGIMAVAGVTHTVKQKKREKSFEEQQKSKEA